MKVMSNSNIYRVMGVENGRGVGSKTTKISVLDINITQIYALAKKEGMHKEDAIVKTREQ